MLLMGVQPMMAQGLKLNADNVDDVLMGKANPSGKLTYTIKFAASVEDVRATGVYTQAKSQSVAGHDVCKPNMELR